MLKKNMPSQIRQNQTSVTRYVPHSMRYHAEIQYEGEVAMRMVCCAGDNLDELATDISEQLLRLEKALLPQIIHVEDIFNQEVITDDFLEDYNNGVYNDR